MPIQTLSNGRYAESFHLSAVQSSFGSLQGFKIKQCSILFHFCPASKRDNFSSTKEKEDLSPELNEFKGEMGSTLRDPRGISYVDWLKLHLLDYSIVKDTENILTALDSSGPIPGARDDIKYPMK